jgi:RHS repeat-associated protein
MWTWRYYGAVSDRRGYNSKHVFLGDTRIVTKVVIADGMFFPNAERLRKYYYHSDHLGSAQLITDHEGAEYERLEYTPYGELWIDKSKVISILDIPYRFTGKERDEETGLYYFGARYLDAKTSRWLSVDPAMSEYVPAPWQDAAKLPGLGGVFNYVNLHVYHYGGNNPVKYVDPTGEFNVKSFVQQTLQFLLNSTPTGEPNVTPRSLYNQQYHTDYMQNQGYKKILGALGLIPGIIGQVATVANLASQDSGINQNIVSYNSRRGFIIGAEAEIARLDELINQPQNPQFQDFLYQQRNLLQTELDLNMAHDANEEQRIINDFRRYGARDQYDDKRSLIPDGRPIDYPSRFEYAP